MILIDLNQVFIANLMQSMKKGGGTPVIDENIIRHMVLNTLRSYIKKYKTRYGDIVVCCDSKHYWRKDYFPLYKANRKKTREESPLDWTLIFDCLTKIREELQENLPYKVICVDGAEADDVIGTISKRTKEDILIISSDGDFAQLQKYPNVAQFSPMLNQYITVEDPAKYLKEHILRGDSGDGIPNVLSANDVFVTKTKQKSMTKERINKWLEQNPAEFSEEMAHNYERNRTLIDLDAIPQELTSKIIEAFETPRKGNRQKLMTYFMENRMKELMSLLDEF